MTLQDVMPVAGAYHNGTAKRHTCVFMTRILLYSRIFNCCLINIKDMLDNGTVMNGKMIESPELRFLYRHNAVLAAVASNQYGEPCKRCTRQSVKEPRQVYG